MQVLLVNTTQQAVWAIMLWQALRSCSCKYAPSTASAHLRGPWLDRNLASLHNIIPNVIIVRKVLM